MSIIISKEEFILPFECTLVKKLDKELPEKASEETMILLAKDIVENHFEDLLNAFAVNRPVNR